MSEVWQRILMAAFLAISGCLITYTLTTSSKDKFARSLNEEPVAVIVASENEVQRRLSDRLVWRRVFDNQYLYGGEAIRTALGSTATIEFMNQKTTVQLDPETVVEIEMGESGINLDFLKGNLFISSAEPSSSLTLSSGGEKIEIQNAEVSLAKADVNANLQVEVSKGSVKGETKQTEARIEIISPLPRQIFYTGVDDRALIPMEWKSLSENYVVSVEIGDSPLRLTKSEVQPVAGETKTSLPLSIGRYYFKLTARDVNNKLPTMTSFTRRVELRQKLAPITLEPARGSKVTASNDRPTIDFRWANPGQLDNIVVEYARSQDLRTDHAIQRVRDDLVAKIPLRWRSGEIFWRVSGTIPGTREVVASKITVFTLTSDQVAVPTLALATPAPTPVATPIAVMTPGPSPTVSPSPSPKIVQATPAAVPKPKIAAPQVDESVAKEGIVGAKDGTAQVSWKPVAEAKQYQVEVKDLQGNVVQSAKVNETATSLSNLKTGEYKITLNSIDRAGNLSAQSSEISLTIPEYSSVRAPKIKSMTVK